MQSHWYDKIYYWGYRIKDRVSFILSTKHKLQKEHRQIGLTYWDRPLKRFDFDAYSKIAWEVYPILIRFRRCKLNGVPLGFVKNEEPDMDAWLDTIDSIIYSFYEILTDFYYFDNHLDAQQHEQRLAKIEEGLKLFSTHFEDLWD